MVEIFFKTLSIFIVGAGVILATYLITGVIEMFVPYRKQRKVDEAFKAVIALMIIADLWVLVAVFITGGMAIL